VTKIDQFESAFKSADKPIYTYERIEIDRVLVVTDLTDDDAAPVIERIHAFLGVLAATQWEHLPGDAFGSVQQLLDFVAERAPDLVVTYRHLHSSAWNWQHSLGEYLDVLTQATEVPVLVLPHPDAERALPHALSDTDRVMAITDHITGDERLLNYALRLTSPGGTCWLTHIENRRNFDRFVDVISRVPEIDTETARTLIAAQLLKEPRDYIASCRALIEKEVPDVSVEALVAMGERLAEYRAMIEAHDIDLLVMNTMDGDQLAMHGQAYPLAVELRQIPLLML
jgi:hypothetical protein